MKIMTKFVACVAALCLLCGLCACGGDDAPEPVEIDEPAFTAEASSLLLRAEKLNTILFTADGLPVLDTGFRIGNYAEISKAKLLALGMKTLDDVRRETARVFSDETVQMINNLVWEPLRTEGDTNVTYARYITYKNNVDPDDPHNGTILTYTGDVQSWSDGVEFDESSFTFGGAFLVNGRVEATLLADVTVTAKDGKTQVRKQLDFIFCQDTDGAWRLDTLPCVVYDDRIES